MKTIGLMRDKVIEMYIENSYLKIIFIQIRFPPNQQL